MPRRVKQEELPELFPKQRPAETLDGREGQLVALSMDLAEYRMRTNTASSQEVVHFLRLGSVRERLERERLENEVRVLQAKVQAYEARANSDEKYKKALRAFSRYSGTDDDDEDEEYDDEDVY